MLTHTVFFWAKDDLSSAQLADFQAGLVTLPRIPSVSAGWAGTASATTLRKAVDRSYTFALSLRFKDLAAHDAYQTDPIHDAFHARCEKYWKRVVVYDFDDLP
jgi:Stress responsive A/B Barrel Domain